MKTKRGSIPLIINPLTNSQLDFIDVLVADLELETIIEDYNKGTEMFMIVLVRKMSKVRMNGNNYSHMTYSAFFFET
jgi:hypothetical protein